MAVKTSPGVTIPQESIPELPSQRMQLSMNDCISIGCAADLCGQM